MRSRYLILFIALMFCLFMTGAFIALYDEEITVERHNITSPDQDDHFMVVKKHNRLNNSVELYSLLRKIYMFPGILLRFLVSLDWQMFFLPRQFFGSRFG